MLELYHLVLGVKSCPNLIDFLSFIKNQIDICNEIRVNNDITSNTFALDDSPCRSCNLQYPMRTVLHMK